MNTLLRFIEAYGLNSQTIESLPASQLDHLLFIYLFYLIQYLSRGIQFSRASLNGALTQHKTKRKTLKQKKTTTKKKKIK